MARAAGRRKTAVKSARKARADRHSPRAALQTYRAKRDFSRTREPSGEAPAGEAPARKPAARTASAPRPGKLRYLIQKHDASRLHYDFRLELDGVLKSWAVPKGPSLDPAKKVLAVQVEDHPLEYGSFEGTIPEGQYGGGTVMLWDRGTWEPEGDPRSGLKSGKLHFSLHGEKLRGQWALVRMHGRESDTKENWLLMKLKDEFAQAGRDITADSGRSVKTGRAMEEIATRSRATWQSNKTKASPSRFRKLWHKAAAEETAPQSDPAPSPPQRTSTRAAAAPPPAIRLTHPDKILYPANGITKQHLIDYYQVAAEWMLPLVMDRPLTLVRCPQGAAAKCFYQRNWMQGFPPPTRGTHTYGGQRQLAIMDLSGLLSLVQMNALEIHTWGCRQDDLKHPDQLVFDFDPGPGLSWTDLVNAARTLRKMFDQLNLPTFIKTTGGKGLHVLIPIVPNVEWEAAHAFCVQTAELLARQSDLIVTNMRKDLREGKLYVDVQRNHETATAVAAYSTRARPGAAVSMPVEWEELKRITSGDQFTLPDASAYLRKRKRDPWADFESARVDLQRIAASGAGKGSKK